MINGLYDLLEGLINARYDQHKLPKLEKLNSRLEILRHQSRLLLDFELVAVKRYEFAGKGSNFNLGDSWGRVENIETLTPNPSPKAGEGSRSILLF